MYFIRPLGFCRSFQYSWAKSAIVVRRRDAAEALSFGSIVGGSYACSAVTTGSIVRMKSMTVFVA